MKRLSLLTAMVGGTLLLAWRVLRRKPVKPDEPEDYDGVVVAPTG